VVPNIYRLKLLFFIGIVLAIISACDKPLFDNSSGDTNHTPASPCQVVEHAMGESCVPYQPQRVVSLGDAANTVALGVKPVAGIFRGGFESFLGERIAGVEHLPVGDLSLETIVALKPDLILGTYHEKIYNQLSQIAPTVVPNWETGSDWKKIFFKEAEALGRVEQAQQLMADYETRLAQFKAEMNIDETPSGENRSNQIKVSVVRIYPDGIAVYFKDSFCGSILVDAGLSRPSIQNELGGQQRLSKERIRDLDADVMFLWTYGYNAEQAQQANSALKKLKADPLWSQLEVVKQGKVYEVPDYWIGDSILAANAVVDDLFKYLMGKEDKE